MIPIFILVYIQFNNYVTQITRVFTHNIGGLSMALLNWETAISGLVDNRQPLCSKCGKRWVSDKTSKLCDECKKKKSPCFIASACYGDISAPEVEVLRQFRDDRLLPTRFGQLFVRLYYKLSPPFANWLSQHQRIAGFVKVRILNPIVWAIRSRN